MDWKEYALMAVHAVVGLFLVMLFMGAAFWGVDAFFTSRRDKTPCSRKCALVNATRWEQSVPDGRCICSGALP